MRRAQVDGVFGELKLNLVVAVLFVLAPTLQMQGSIIEKPVEILQTS